MWRSLAGQTNFFIINVCVQLLPLSLLVILFQTNPFWITILSFVFNNEPIIPREIIGMVICFLGVVIISLNNQKVDQEEVEQVDALTETTKAQG